MIYYDNVMKNWGYVIIHITAHAPWTFKVFSVLKIDLRERPSASDKRRKVEDILVRIILKTSMYCIIRD